MSTIPTTSPSPLRRALALVVVSAITGVGAAVTAMELWPESPVLRAAGIAGALACVVLVAWVVLSGLFRSHVRIAEQVTAARHGADPSVIGPVIGRDATSLAWNEFVELVGRRTALGQIEARLRETIGGLKRRECDQVLDSLPDGVAVESGGVVRFANRAFHALLGGDGEEANGRPIESLLTIDERARAELEAADRPIVVESHLGATPADGVLRVSRLPLLGEGGTETHVWTVRDVTHQKLAEAMRDNFVSSATHELRTPLANIKAYSEMLATLDAADLDRQKEFCNIIDGEVTRLSRFVDDLLSIDQMESGALSLVRGDTDVQRLVRDVCENVRPQMDAKSIEFETLFPQKFPKLQLDKDKFAAALVNLLGNAAKYTPDGGTVRLVIEYGNDKLRFHIEDTGIGIAPEEAERVFEKFFRSEDDRVRDLAGNGLGLSFTREVVRLHGGDVTVHSELNKGTRFTVTLAT